MYVYEVPDVAVAVSGVVLVKGRFGWVTGKTSILVTPVSQLIGREVVVFST